MATTDLELEVFHKKCKRIAGNEWCPYPSEDFILAVLISDNETAKSLIEKRRKFLFPHFLIGEPMRKEIDDVFKRYNI